MRKEIRQKEVFIASDNREFDNEKYCLLYEKELGYTIKTDFLIINTMLIIPFILSLTILPYYNSNEYWLMFSIMLFTGILSLISIITLIYRKWKK